MKKYFVILIFLFASCKEKKSEYSMEVWDMITKLPMPEYYRKVTGYDSIQLIIRNGKLEGNFCYPNEWEFEKWRRDTVYIGDTVWVEKIYNNTK